jgi:hypothetical protein
MPCPTQPAWLPPQNLKPDARAAVQELGWMLVALDVSYTNNRLVCSQC